MHVAITGASSGIGAALAREWTRRGASVTLVARRRELLESLARDLGTQAHLEVADLSDVEHCADWVTPAESALGPIDVLVNCAAAFLAAPTTGVAARDGEALISLNLLAPLRLTQRVLPAMLARNAGTIVDISAMATLAPLPFMAHYVAAKAGLAAASESLRIELKNTNLNVVTVYAGLISDTDMGRTAVAAYESTTTVRMMPAGTAQRLAVLVCNAVERQKARVLYPFPAPLTLWFGGLMRWLFSILAPPLRGTTRG